MDIEKMTLREVADVTKNMNIREGGLSIMIYKIVSEIEKLQKSLEQGKKERAE